MFFLATKAYLSFMAIFLVSFLQDASGMDCVWGGSKSLLDKINPLNPKSCPTLLDDSDKVFCCLNEQTDLGYCCEVQEFVGNVNMLLIGVGFVAALLLVSVICCCCCPCCCVYKRRNGQVYGRAPGYTTVVTTQTQPGGAVPVYGAGYGTQPLPYPVQPTMQPLVQPGPGGYPPQQYAAYPAMAAQQPPTYGEATTQGMYSKQAPYNPSY